MTKIAYIGGIALAICAGIGWMLHDSNSASDAGASRFAVATAQPRSMLTQPSAPMTIDATQLRAIIREELAAARVGANGNAQPVRDIPPTSAPTSSELLAQREDARQAIDSMVAAGVWGNEERLSFQRKLALLAPEQAEQALQQVTMALNDGSIQVMTDGPPI